ncbi:uncharacterized protein LOC122017531 [Zingiber officinale]|uniref:Uncharacterized protein n=1 Tax=Zingiber officinale TaxID=94328 RepID=A0A8J5F9W8_ZINOF|nr:uncharacterized protein LOC122017531 [Zingiber officinale]KAG6481973.1 hypothetical protein ZIOFF_058597 [Zingiber officinale]
MDLNSYPLDLVLVPFSFLLTASYHSYIWFNSSSKAKLAKKPAANAISLSITNRASWNQSILQGKRKDMLGVQSLRNSLMSAILSASTALALAISLAALANNAFNAHRLLRHAFFGSQAGPTVALKYACAMIFLLFSFLANSLAVAFVVDACFLVSVVVEEEEEEEEEAEMLEKQARRMLRRGYVLAVVGNRLLFVSLPMLLWLFGPAAMALSSVALVVLFYELDVGITYGPQKTCNK